MNDDNYEDDEIQKAKNKILEEEEVESPNDDKLGNDVVVEDEPGEEEGDEKQTQAGMVLEAAINNIFKNCL